MTAVNVSWSPSKLWHLPLWQVLVSTSSIVSIASQLLPSVNVAGSQHLSSDIAYSTSCTRDWAACQQGRAYCVVCCLDLRHCNRLFVAMTSERRTVDVTDKSRRRDTGAWALTFNSFIFFELIFVLWRYVIWEASWLIC